MDDARSNPVAFVVILVSIGAAILLLGIIFRSSLPFVDDRDVEGFNGFMDTNGRTSQSPSSEERNVEDASLSLTRQVYDLSGRIADYPVRTFRAPYLQRPTRTGIEVAWRTPIPEVGRVVYGDQKGFLGSESVEPESRTKHHIRLSGLLPSSRYYYEVYSGGVKIAGEDDFRTARRHDETRFSFLVLGDSGVDEEVQWAVARQMRSSMYGREVDFIVHLGDVHQGDGDDYDDVYFKPYRDIIKNVNVYTALGNHDVRTDNGGVYLDDFYLPNNNPDSTERYYSFRWANAYFICLDTNIDYSPGSAQHDFLLSALKDSLRQAATWTILYAHHPPYSEHWTGYYGERGVQEHLVPVFEQHGVDMVMNGHTHSYERGEKNHVHYLVSGGGGGALDDFFVDYDHVSYSDAVHHFTRVDIDGDEASVSAIDAEGHTIDRFTIEKRSTVSMELSVPPKGLTLDQNFPNPFSSETTIRYGVSEPAHVRLVVYDTRGREVSILVDRSQNAGTYAVGFDAAHLTSGSYVYELSAGGASRRLLLTVVK